MENEIRELAAILGDSSSHVIAQYTRWYFINAIIWSVVWITAFILVYRIDLSKYEEEIDEFPGKIVKCVLCFFFGVFFAMCLPNILAPEPYAIHQLIYEIRG